MSLKVSTAASVRNTNTVKLQAVHVGKCSFTCQAKNHSLLSPVLGKRRSARGQTISTASRKSLTKNVLKKDNPRGAVKQWGISQPDCKLSEKQVPFRVTRADNVTKLSPKNISCPGDRVPVDYLSTSAETPGGSIDKESTPAGKLSNSDNHTIHNVLLDPMSTHTTEATQTAALLANKISVNSKAKSRRSRFCPLSVSDTSILVRKRRCVSCCPSTRRHTEDVTKNVDCSTVGHVQTQPNDNYQSDLKNYSQRENIDISGLTVDNERKIVSLKYLETSSLNLLKNLGSNNVPIETTVRTGSCYLSPTGSSTESDKSLPVLRGSDISPQETIRLSDISPQQTIRVSDISPQQTIRVSDISPQQTIRVDDISRQQNIRVSDISSQQTIRGSDISPQQTIRVSDISPQQTIRVSAISPQQTIRVSDISTQQTNNSSLTDTLAPSIFSATSSQTRHPSTGSSDIPQLPNSPSHNTTQQPCFVSNSQEQARSPMPWRRLEERIAKLLPACSHADEDTCFDQMVELALRILYTMYIKESSNRGKKASTPEADGNELPDNPGVETVKRNYKHKCKDTVGSSLLVKRWNPQQCIQETKPLLQVKYNAPVRPTSRSASRSVRSELRTKSESPKKLEKSVSDKPSTYVKKKVFVPPSGDAVSPKKAEKLKKRQTVASTSPRKLSSIAPGNHKVSNVITIIPNLQARILKAEQASGIIPNNVCEKSNMHTTPVVQPNSARVKKINYRSSNWCRTNDRQIVRKGVLNGKDKSNTKRIEDSLTSNRTKQKRCWTSLADETPSSVSSLRANSQSRNRTKAQSTMWDLNLVDCQDCSNGKLTTSQQVSPKRSYGMENILLGGLREAANGEKRFAKFLSNQTNGRQRSVSVSIQEKPLVNPGSSECLGVSENCDLMKLDQLLRHQKSNCDTEKYKVDKHKIDGKNVPKWHNLHDKQGLVRNELKAKRRHQRACQDSSKDDARFCPQSWSVEGGFREKNSRNRELDHQYSYSQQHARGKNNKLDEPIKSLKCQGHRLKYNCENSGDCQFSKHREEHDLAANRSNPSRSKYWKLSPAGLEYCNVNTFSDLAANRSNPSRLMYWELSPTGPEHCNVNPFSDRVTTDKHISTADLFQVGSTHLILPGKSRTKESNEKIDTGRESFQSGENIHYCSLPVNSQTIKNTFNMQYQQLPAREKNVLPNSKCHFRTEPSLLQLFDDEDSTSGILPALSRMSPSDAKHSPTENVEGKDKPCELGGAEVTMGANRTSAIQPQPNELECQNYLGDMKSRGSLCIPKRRNLSRWHVIGHHDKDLQMGQKATISTRSRNDDEEGHAVLFSNDAFGRCDNTCQQTVIKDCQRRMKNPCGHVIPGYLAEIAATLLLEGGEPTVTGKLSGYSSAGDGSLRGKVRSPEHCYLQSEIQQTNAEHTNKNISGISSDHPDNIIKPKDCYLQHTNEEKNTNKNKSGISSDRPDNIIKSKHCCLQSALQQIYENSIKNKSVISSNDNLLNKTDFHSAQTGPGHLEANTDISRDFDKTSLLRNCSQFSCVHSASGQSERVDMDNLIILKDANVDKFNSDSRYLLPHNLTESNKHLRICEIRWMSAKTQQDNRMICWTNQRETQSNLVKQNIPGGNQNCSEHPFICMEKTPWAHSWNRLQVISVQDEPLDLSRKSKRVSTSVTHLERTCGSVLYNAVPGVSRHTFFPLQSSPLNLSAK